MSKPIRVLSIAHAGVSREAGRLRYHELAGRDDLDVHLVVPSRWHQFGQDLDADPVDDPGITVHILPIWLPKAGPMSWYLHVYPGLRRLIRRLKPDVIHLWEEPWSMVALQACLLRAHARVILEVDMSILKRLPPPFEAVRRFTLSRTSHILARSPDAEEVVRARGYRGPIARIGYGVDAAVFRPDETTRRRPSPMLRIGYVGRLVPEKGLDDALDAIAMAEAPVTLAILGEGPYAPQLRQRVETLGLGDRVSFQGWASPDAVATFMRGLDAVILLTRTTRAVKEQFGRVIIEAQACGVPVIGSTGGAIPSVVGPGGWIVPESDPAGLARLLERLATAPEERLARAQAGLQNVADHFTLAAVAEVLARAWTTAAASPPPSTALSSTPH